MISNQQHGCIKRRSIVTNLAIFTKFVNQALQDRCQVDVIYLDFAKAFDSVDIDILNVKMVGIDLPSNLRILIHDYLIGRSRTVNVGHYSSYEFVPSKGVPQGSLLGAPLFLIYINDVTDNIESSILLFADDVKIFRIIRYENDAQILQNDLNTLQNWSIKNGLALNVEKCNCMSFVRSKTLFLSILNW